MLNKLQKMYRTDNFSYFIRYFAVFTLIFVLMTMMILQVMRATMYRNSDETFEEIAQNPSMIVHLALAREAGIDVNSSEGDNQPFKPYGKMNLNTNYHVILYSSKGKIVNQLDRFSGLYKLDLNTKELDTIHEVEVESIFGENETYRMMTVQVDSEELSLPSSQDVKYVTILLNTTQIRSSITSYEKTVILVMTAFWIISIIASIYLAQLTVKPILASFQKQKDFVENASHELRTPLAVLQNRLENLFRKPNATIMESSESIASSLEEVRNMRLLTTNLLNLARRDDGLKIEVVDIAPNFFDETFENYAIMAEDNAKQLETDNQVKQTIRTDKILLKQVMTILFDNAIKYTEVDGKIKIHAQLKDRYLLYSVFDDGLGISDENKKKIFDRFYRVDKARTRQKGGFGLGLSLAKQIVDTLKGTITVKDNSPKGTIFEVKIPIHNR